MNNNPTTNTPGKANLQQAQQGAQLSYEKWRETFLSIMLRGASLLGIILVAASATNASFTTLITYASVLLVLLVITFFRLPYALRAAIFIGAVYAIGFYIVINWGTNADGSLFLASAAILAALLFDHRAGITAIAINIITVGVIGWQAITGRLELPENPFGPGIFNNWATYAADMTAAAAIINLAIYFLKRDFNNLLAQASQALETLSTQQGSLEERIRTRTAELSRRSAQLESSAFVSRQAATIQDMGTLLAEVVRLITDRFGYYHTGIFLTDEAQRYVTLQAASSEGGRRMLQRGHRLEIGRQGVVGYAAFEKRPRIALDVGSEAVFFNNPDLPETHSEIALPLLVRNKLIGVLDIQSAEDQSFSEEDIATFQSMADQIALAIENARLLAESQLVISQLQELTSETAINAWKSYLGRQSRGFIYSPVGVSPLGPGDEAKNEEIAAESEIHVPIQLRGRKIGTITLRKKTEKDPWGVREQTLVHDVSTQIGLALENARLLEQSQKQAAQEQSINTISSRLSQALTIDTLLQTAAQELHQLPSVAEVSVYLGSNAEIKNP